jgi:hypothetical protein
MAVAVYRAIREGKRSPPGLRIGKAAALFPALNLAEEGRSNLSDRAHHAELAEKPRSTTLDASGPESLVTLTAKEKIVSTGESL